MLGMLGCLAKRTKEEQAGGFDVLSEMDASPRPGSME